MKLGYAIPNNQGVSNVTDLTLLGQRAEALGYNSVWVSEHLFHASYVAKRLGDRPYHDPLTVLTAVAGATERVRLGTSVLVLPWHHPARLGKAMATLDHLSGGRVDLGVGVAIAQDEFDNLGISFADRGARTDEILAALEALWYQDVPDFAGEYYSFSGQRFEPKPLQARLPIHVGGGAPPALRRTARFGQGWHALGKSPDELKASLSDLDGLMGARTVQDLHISIRCVTQLAGAPWDRPSNQRRTLKGTREEIADTVLAYRDAGVDELVVDANTPDIDENFKILELMADLLA